ncbi:type III secretion protein HrpQ [Pseudomonas synxantha]|uniref:Type III secretion protein HrpQ n=1 Tax=Pseudomonas synxantha TaxID=47883 RepID=A0A3G7UCD5_9PSED|nr:FHA domain-containing protein [Pseudomonas synxantha]AZE56871.1 type III secretion protein HrpQ [Pseudomonas synxantha]
MYELRVLSGLHQQSVLPLIGSQWEVGARESADLALYDPGVEPHHGRLHLDEGGWRIEAPAGRFYDADGQELSNMVPPEQAFRAAGIWLCIAHCESPWLPEPEFISPPPALGAPPASRTVKWQWAWALLPMLITMITMIIVLRPAPAPPAMIKPTKPVLTTPQQVQDTLQFMIEERELRHVTFDVIDGGLVLRADISQKAVLERVIRGFRKDYSSEVSLQLAVHEPVRTLPFRIVQVVAGRNAHITTDEGKQFFVGDEHMGFRLIAIEPTKLRFSGAEPLEVDW